MNVKYRSVLAVGMSVAMMVQAPVVAFASAGAEVSVDKTGTTLTVSEGTSYSTEDSGNTVIITSDIEAYTTYDSSGHEQTALNVESSVSGFTVVANDITINSTNTPPEITGNSITHGTAVDVNGTANFKSDGSQIIGDVVNDGSGKVLITGNVDGSVAANNIGGIAITGNVDGSVTANGSGDIAIIGDVNGDVAANDGGTIGILGYVDGDLTNASGLGSIFVAGGVGGTITTSDQPNVTMVSPEGHGSYDLVIGNATVVDGTISEDQIIGDLNSRSGLYVYKVEDGIDDGNTVNKIPHYIIKSEGDTSLYKAWLTDIDDVDVRGSYTITSGDTVTTHNVASSFEYLDKIQNEMYSPNYPIRYLDYAEAGDTIMFTVPTSGDYTYSVSNNIVARSLGNGLYVLTVPNGGGVDIKVWKYYIERIIEEETGAPAVVVEENTPQEVPVEVASNEGINIITTAAGSALPTTELGNAVAATKSVSLDITKITPAQFRDAITTTVQTVPAGGVAVIETNTVATLDSNMIAAMAARPDVAYNIVFKHDGVKMRVVIPAGYDVKSLLDEHGYCGFLRLAAILGFTVLE